MAGARDRLRRTFPCVRCGVARVRLDKKPEPEVCGSCAAQELLRCRIVPRAIRDSAREFVAANSTADMMKQLGCSRDRIEELRRRAGL